MFRAAKILIDANFCDHAAEKGILLLDTGMRVFHFGEGTFQASRELYRARPADAPWGDHWRKEVLYDNPPNWGLGDAPVVERRPGHSRLDFADRAVPPLVSLRRVMKPVTVARR